MSGKRAPKGLLVWIWQNFRESVTKKRPAGNLIGKDYLGTSYYELPADPQGGKRNPSRWFAPLDKQEFDQHLPPEWEAWLRGRRANPPTKEEIEANMALADLKKIKAKELEAKEPSKSAPETSLNDTSKKAFPTYDEYEIIPGKDRKQPS